MTAVRSRAQALVGSAQWVNDENDQAAQFCAQESEDFAFSARNEVEWLNEHMADIFSKNQKDITECFKTPGKLRGKTPRTVRKRDPLEIRAPLTDIFSTNAPPNDTPIRGASPSKTAATFKVAEDPVAPATEKKAAKANTDSGYHGLPEDDMDVDDLLVVPQSSAATNDTVEISPKSSTQEQPPALKQPEDRSTTDRSFHSAREEFTEKIATESEQREAPQDVDAGIAFRPIEHPPIEPITCIDNSATAEPMDMDDMDKDLDEDLVVGESHSPSQGSTPARPLARKSSLTFAPLPPRELTTKKSIGARASQISHSEQSKGNVSRGSLLEQLTAGKSLGGPKQPEYTHDKDVDDDMDVDADRPGLSREESDTDSRMTKLHNKSSTQRLHDRINMLGKSQPARPTKSITASAAINNLNYPELPKQEQQPRLTQDIVRLTTNARALPNNEEDDHDWIQPPQPQATSSSRPQLPKSISTDVMEGIVGKRTVGGEEFGRTRHEEQLTRQASPSSHPKAREGHIDDPPLHRRASESQSPSPALAAVEAHVDGPGSAAPTGISSSKRYVDGPLSASKSKLQTIMKTARGLFSSSAGVSAQAKMETLSPSSMCIRKEALEPSIDAALDTKNLQKIHQQSPVPNPVGRKTRSSTEKEEKRKEAEARERGQAVAKASQIRGEEIAKTAAEKARDPVAEAVQQQAKPIRPSPRKTQQTQEAPGSQLDAAEEAVQAQSNGVNPTHAHGQQTQSQRLKDLRRPQKPAKEAASKPKPPPVAIKVGTLSQGMRMNTALSTNLQDSLPPPQPKQPAVAKKPSNPSLHPTVSNTNLKGSVSAAAKPKALIAAERKKEQDEKEAQRKLDQKREIERKRAAQQEEARRKDQLQRQEAERQRERERSAAAEDPKVLSKKQAIEKRRMEMKQDQQRSLHRPIVDHMPNAHQAQNATTARPELGGPRPPSRLQHVPDHGRLANNQPLQNPARPPGKRIFDPEADEEPFRPSRQQGGPIHQPNESKRRKTGDEDVEEVRVRPTMAPPIRQSGIRQGGLKPSIFNNSYTTAPPPAPHYNNSNSLLKSTTANQAYQQHAQQNPIARPGHHPDIAKYQNGKIPFADNPNPPQPHKTPLQSKLNLPHAKSSPQYVNGENIHLDDIPTESEEDSDSDAGATKPKPVNLPDWAQSPQLRELLMMQDENMDADAVFGPVQSPHMEEMFRERHHRFRSRTSSANWAGADRLTEEEIRRDVEARQRLRREGGWTFGL